MIALPEALCGFAALLLIFLFFANAGMPNFETLAERPILASSTSPVAQARSEEHWRCERLRSALDLRESPVGRRGVQADDCAQNIGIEEEEEEIGIGRDAVVLPKEIERSTSGSHASLFSYLVALAQR